MVTDFVRLGFTAATPLPNQGFPARFLASDVTQATLTATNLQPDATNIEFGPAPDASRRTGYQINLEPGANKGTFVRVTAEDEVSTETYYINLNRGVDEEFGWKAAKDIDNLDTTSRYDLATIMGHGNTTWLGNGFRDVLFAYNDDGSRDESRDIELHADNDNLSDTWTDGTNVRVLDLIDRRIYVYRLSDGTKQNSREFSVRFGPRSIWSDGTTMWVGSNSLPTVYAYRLDNGQRQSERDITLRGGQSNTWAMWGDGAILWVAGPAESGQPIVEVTVQTW